MLMASEEDEISVITIQPTVFHYLLSRPNGRLILFPMGQTIFWITMFGASPYTSNLSFAPSTISKISKLPFLPFTLLPHSLHLIQQHSEIGHMIYI